MTHWDDTLWSLLNTLRVEFEQLSDRDKWQHQQEWRECYCLPLKEATGKWSIGRYDWNTFDHRYARCLAGARAIDAYRHCSVDVFLIIPDTGSGLRCRAALLPDLSHAPREYYIFPPNLDWTMVFSHEGPFFSRREWVTGG